MTRGLRVWDTMKQAAAALNVPLSLLKKAKSAGCDAFVGSRIYEDKLAPWLADHRQEIAEKRSKEDVQIEKLLEEVRKIRTVNDERDKILVKRERVVQSFQALKNKILPFCEAKLEKEYPSVVAGMDVAAARVYGRSVHDQIALEIQKCEDLWNF
jgi:beta-glucosidase-like glycosyl hydrolase